MSITMIFIIIALLNKKKTVLVYDIYGEYEQRNHED